MQLFTQHPEIVCRSVGLPPVTLKGVSIKPMNHGGSKIVIENQ
jgi:hypothetical protein